MANNDIARTRSTWASILLLVTITIGACAGTDSVTDEGCSGQPGCRADATGEPDTLSWNDATPDIITSGPASPVSFVSAAWSADSSSNLTIARPAEVEEGDLLVAGITRGGDTSEISAPDGWDLVLTDHNDSSSGTRTSIFWKVAGSLEPSNYSFSLNHADSNAGGIAVFRDVHPTDPIATSASSRGDGEYATAPSIEGVAGGMLLSFFGSAQREVSTSPDGMTEIWAIQDRSGNDASSTASYEPIDADPTGPRQSTFSGGDDWVAANLAIAPQGDHSEPDPNQECDPPCADGMDCMAGECLSQPLISFANDVQPLLGVCVGCHGNGAQAPNLSSNAHGNLVGVQAAECSGRTFVIPSDPDNSYLVHKLEGAADVCGQQMPRGGTPLSVHEIQIVRDWIQEGALDN
ncbi:MAG: hypothetical protein ACNA8W_04100 [Bradymonadaceae bacterium]